MIRYATEADAPALAELYLASEGAARQSVGAGPVAAGNLTSWFRDRMRLARVFMTEDGFAEIADHELRALYVHPDRWGTGVADVLHAKAIEELRANGVDEAHLVVIATNLRARRFYERHGWRYAGDADSRVIGGVTLPFTHYSLRLAR